MSYLECPRCGCYQKQSEFCGDLKCTCHEEEYNNRTHIDQALARVRELRKIEKRNGIAALRNAAAPAMLDLLEALLARELAVEACTNSAPINQGHFDVVLESKMDAAIEAVQPALAAFVEGKDGQV